MLSKPHRKVDEALLARVRGQPCIICKRRPSDPSHIISRGAGGPDEDWNVVPMCREHHQVWHQYGVATFLTRFPVMRLVLSRLGWTVEVIPGGATKLRRH